MTRVHTPYLIQRGAIKSPLADATARLSQAIELDYMGSAEFEFGALPKSFRRIEAAGAGWVCRLVNEIKEGDTPLRVWSEFSDEQFEEYKVFLHRLRDPNAHGGPLRTKEGVRFEHNYSHSKYFVTNFWWDINNDVMFGFHKEAMKRVGSWTASSLAYMNEMAAK